MHLAACKQNTETCHQTAQHYTTYSTTCFRDDSVIISLMQFWGIQRYFSIRSAGPHVSNAFVWCPNLNCIIFLLYLFFYKSFLHSEIHIKYKLQLTKIRVITVFILSWIVFPVKRTDIIHHCVPQSESKGLCLYTLN